MGMDGMTFDIFQRDRNNQMDCNVLIRMVSMRDGICLYTRIYLPMQHARHAVVLSRFPYNSPDNFAPAPRSVYLHNRIVFVGQDCRGTGQSQGDAQPYGLKEREDAEDTIRWICSQQWSNGKLGMEGGSYGGAVQWLAALSGMTYLVAIAPHNCSANMYDEAFVGGALFFQLKFWWAFSQHYKRQVQFSPAPNWDESGIATHRPLCEMDRAAGLDCVPYWQCLLRDWIYSKEWDYGNAVMFPERVIAPAYIVGGWFDFYNGRSIDSFHALRTGGGTEEVRNFTRLVMGPWTHIGNKNPNLFDEHGHGEDYKRTSERFLIGLLNNPEDDPIPDEPVVRYFMMGKNEWRSSEAWPPEGVRETPFYLHATRPANTAQGDGTLDSLRPSTDEPADHYVYDPADPVLSRGGCFLGPKECGDGCVTQMCIENRQDVLCYTSQPLENDLEIVGQVQLVLWVASSCVDTDFTAKLVDVWADGTSYNILDGIQRMRFREGVHREVFLTPGEPVKITIDLWHTAHTFGKGHRIRVHVSSSNFPHFDQNMNTGNELGTDAEGVRAKQTVFHCRIHPSYIMLPVLSQC